MKICPFHLEAVFLPNSLIITGLDNNSLAESTFLDKLGCRSDVTPVQLKLIIHHGLAPAPLGQGWHHPWPRGALPF